MEVPTSTGKYCENFVIVCFDECDFQYSFYSKHRIWIPGNWKLLNRSGSLRKYGLMAKGPDGGS